MLDTVISACLNSTQASNEHRRPAARAAPLFNSQRNTEIPTDRIASTGDRRSDGSDSPPTTGTPCAADRERNARTVRM